MEITAMGLLVWAHGIFLVLMPAIVAMFFIPTVHKPAQEHGASTEHRDAA